MMDLLYLSVLAIFFVATNGLLKLCDCLSHEQHGERS